MAGKLSFLAGRSRSASGCVALVTGASSGIGEALAREVARRGGRAVLAARRTARIEAIAKEIQAAGGQALAVSCDVNREGDVERAVEEAREAFGAVDIVVANAGFGVTGRFETLSVDDFRRQFETNVFGVVRTVQATLPELRRSRGSIAIIGSVMGYFYAPGNSAYSMSKAAVRALADSLRVELGGDGISVTHVGPGFIESEIRRVDNRGAFDASREDYVPRWLVMPADEAARQILDAIVERRDEAIITRHGKLAVSLVRHAPSVVATVMAAPDRFRRLKRAR